MLRLFAIEVRHPKPPAWGVDLSKFRKEYSERGLHRADLAEDPIAQFEQWFSQATSLGIPEPNAFTLATVDVECKPLQRTVLLKYFDGDGFVFFTNYESRKAAHIAKNPEVCMLFPWISLERQVIVQGAAEKVSPAESLNYFSTRPRDSRLGAWVSHQSSVISSRKLLAQKLDEIRRKFGEGEIPIPSFWGGYRVRPRNLEFWQGGAGRLHDRFLYEKRGAGWAIERLSP